MMDVVIGIPTYNGADRLASLLRSIALRTPSLADNGAVVVIDDGSPDPDSIRRVWEAWVPHARAMGARYALERHPVNKGISAGWNAAARRFLAEHVVLINDDVIVSEGWLEALLHVLRKSPYVGVVGQNWHAFLPEDVPGLVESRTSDRAVVPRDPVSKKQTPERRGYEGTNPGRVMAPTGQLFAFRRRDFDAIGGFDEGFKSFYEETDFGTKMAAHLQKIGVQIAWPFCWHQWSATFGQNPELRASERMRASHEHYCRNWLVPKEFHDKPFEYTNPKHLGSIGDVEVEFLLPSGPTRGVLRQDSAFVLADEYARQQRGPAPT